MFGFEYETSPRMAHAAEQIEILKREFPKLKFYFLCNSPKETENFRSIGQNAECCSHNAFLRENRFFVTGLKKRFDAVYSARITPFKRNELALEVPNLLMIGTYYESEKKYVEGVLSQRRADSIWIRKVRGLLMFYYFNRSRVGLCLSRAEGAMYTCAEYGLCGLPVVTCKCLGGREYSISPEYTFFTETDSPTAGEVAALVADVIAKDLDPRKIRAATIAVLNEHRRRYEDLLRRIFDESGTGSPADFKRAVRFPHKFGVRCRVSSFFKMTRMLKI